MHVLVFVFVFAAASVNADIVIHCFRREVDMMRTANWERKNKYKPLTVVRNPIQFIFPLTSIGRRIIIYSYFYNNIEVSTLPYFALRFFLQVCACASFVLFLYCFIILFPL